MCVYIYIYIYIYTHVCACVYIYIERERDRERCVYIYIYVHVCVYIYIYTHVCMYIYIYIYIYVYIYIYMYIYIVSGPDGVRLAGQLALAILHCHRCQFCEIGVPLLSLQNSQKQPPRYFRGGQNMARGTVLQYTIYHTIGQGLMGVSRCVSNKKGKQTTIHNTIDYTILQTRPYYTVLYYTILHCTTLYYTILHYTTLYYTILHYTTLYYTILHYTTLYYLMMYMRNLLGWLYQAG